MNSVISVKAMQLADILYVFNDKGGIVIIITIIIIISIVIIRTIISDTANVTAISCVKSI